MKESDIRTIIKKGALLSELDYERALRADRTLRTLVKDNPHLLEIRNELRNLLVTYESIHWADVNSISQKQLIQSDIAEQTIQIEEQFFKKRKELVLARLSELGLIQKDLGTLLNHSKSYTSELLNGIRAFSSNDLILIHKLLKINLNDLFPTYIPLQTQQRIEASISKISSKSVKLNTPELELVIV